MPARAGSRRSNWHGQRMHTYMEMLSDYTPFMVLAFLLERLGSRSSVEVPFSVLHGGTL